VPGGDGGGSGDFLSVSSKDALKFKAMATTKK
jgi:hypothetical protein